MMRCCKKGRWNISFCKKPDRFAQAYVPKIDVVAKGEDHDAKLAATLRLTPARFIILFLFDPMSDIDANTVDFVDNIIRQRFKLVLNASGVATEGEGSHRRT